MQTTSGTGPKPVTPDEYVAGLPDDRKMAVAAIRDTINKNIPKGFEERIGMGGIMWAVPHSQFPAGYHCDPSKPLMLMSIASTKGHVALHHMGLYGSGPLMNWFTAEWPKHSPKKLDIGKACIRFKKPEEAPLELIGKLAAKLTPQAWVEIYQKALQR